LPKQTKSSIFIPLNSINGLYFIATRSDLKRDFQEIKENVVIKLARKFGHCPLQVLWDTRKVVEGLEHLEESHFPRNIITPEVRRGKSVQASTPSSTGNTPSRPNEVWHMDTVGPIQTTSVLGYKYNISFTCGVSGYVLSYRHAVPPQVSRIQEEWYADRAGFQELHGGPRFLHCDNASVKPDVTNVKEIGIEGCLPHRKDQHRTFDAGGEAVLHGMLAREN